MKHKIDHLRQLFLHTTLSTLLIIAVCRANVTDDPNDTEGGESLVTSGSKTCSFFAGRSKLMLTSFFSLLSRYGLIVSLRTQAHLYAVSTFVINKEHLNKRADTRRFWLPKFVEATVVVISSS